MHVSLRRTGTGATALVAALTVAVLAAPGASAGVNALAVNSGGGGSGSAQGFGVDCSYELVATVDNTNQPVSFTDNGVAIPGSPVPPSGGTGRLTWTPTSVGPHTLVASQNGPNKSVTQNIDVRRGLPLSACLVL